MGIIEKTEDKNKPNSDKWGELTALLQFWHEESINELKELLNTHYSTAEELLLKKNDQNNLSRKRLNDLSKQVNNPKEHILDELYQKLVFPKISSIPPNLREPWQNGVKQVEYAFSQFVQPLMEDHMKKLKLLQNNSPNTDVITKSQLQKSPIPPSAIKQQQQVPAVKSSAVDQPPQSRTPSAQRGRGRGRGGRTNRFAAGLGGCGGADVQKMLDSLSQIANKSSDDEE